MSDIDCISVAEMQLGERLAEEIVVAGAQALSAARREGASGFNDSATRAIMSSSLLVGAVCASLKTSLRLFLRCLLR